VTRIHRLYVFVCRSLQTWLLPAKMFWGTASGRGCVVVSGSVRQTLHLLHLAISFCSNSQLRVFYVVVWSDHQMSSVWQVLACILSGKLTCTGCHLGEIISERTDAHWSNRVEMGTQFQKFSIESITASSQVGESVLLPLGANQLSPVLLFLLIWLHPCHI